MAANPGILLEDWKWMAVNEPYSLIAISPFGDLLLKDCTDALCMLDVNEGKIEYATDGGDDPALLFPINFDDTIARGYRDAGLELGDGTCYGYKVQLVAGGSLEAHNVYIATLTEYVSFMGHFHYSIRDVEDGETVTLKVVWGKPN
jgi:hypothetical protein